MKAVGRRVLYAPVGDMCRLLVTVLVVFTPSFGPTCSAWRTDEQLMGIVTQANLGQRTIAASSVHFSAPLYGKHIGRPLLLPQLAGSWPAVNNSSRRWSRERLQVLAGSTIHRVRCPVGQRTLGLVGGDYQLRSFLSSIAQHGSSGAGAPLLFSRTTVGIAEADWWIPEPFVTRQLTSHILSVGGSGAGLALHNHGEAFEAVVVGRKLMLFLPPLPYGHGSKSKNTAAARLRLLSMPVAHLVTLPPAQRDALISTAGWKSSDLTSCILMPGDVVWIPCNYYHGTMNIGDTVAVGGQYSEESQRRSGIVQEDCPSDIYSLSTVELSKVSKLVSVAEASPAQLPDRHYWDDTVLLQTLDKADLLLHKSAEPLAMNAEAAMWAARSAFLRRRVTGIRTDQERSAFSRLNNTSLMWAAAAVATPTAGDDAGSPPSIDVAHAAAVLIGIARQLVAEMQRRLHSDDTFGWDSLTFLTYSVQERAATLLSEYGTVSSYNPGRSYIQGAKIMLGVTMTEFYLAIGQVQLAGREGNRALQILNNYWSSNVGISDAVNVGWIQMLHSPPAESALMLEEVDTRLRQVIDQAHREL